MSTVIHPVGPKRPEIYWRRRVVALVVTVLLVVGMVLGVKALIGALVGGDEKADTAGQQQAGESSDAEGSDAEGSEAGGSEAGGSDAEASDAKGADAEKSDEQKSDEEKSDAEAPASGPPECGGEQISLLALSDATSYSAGGKAKLGMRITNTGKAACTMDAGSAALELMVVSGEDRIWSSDDCQKSAQSSPTTVSPGEKGALESSVEWPLVRSAKGCPKDLPALKAGTYQLVARAGELTSAPLVFAIK